MWHNHRLLTLTPLLLTSVLLIGGCNSGGRGVPGSQATSHPSAVLFTDATASAGISFLNDQGDSLESILQVMGSGAAWGDYDNDGALDLYLVNGPGSGGGSRPGGDHRGSVLYRNNGDATFTDVTASAGVGFRGWGMGAVFGDVDNDGLLDLYLTNNGPNVLFHNQGDGTFRDITREAGVGDPRWSTGAAFSDIDNDGDLDLYVANYLEFRRDLIPAEAKMAYDRDEPAAFLPHLFPTQRNTLYRNDSEHGRVTFTDVTVEAGVPDLEGKSLGVAFSDYDNDGDQDLYIANDVSNDVLFRNDLAGSPASPPRTVTFSNINVGAGVDDPRGGMGVCFGDYDNDGDFDVFVTNWQDEMNVLYRNSLPRGGVGKGYIGSFDDVTLQAGLGEASLGYVGWGTGFFDMDNDGDLDLFVANGYTSPGKDPRTCKGERNLLFRNNLTEEGRPIFAEIGSTSGDAFRRELVGRGAAFGDYDNDGDVDIAIVNNNGPAMLLRNDTDRSQHWLKVRLSGTKSNRFGVGARITVVCAGKRQIREVNAGSSYLSCNSLEAEFGLGASTVVDSLIAAWPSGVLQALSSVPVDRAILVTEGADR